MPDALDTALSVDLSRSAIVQRQLAHRAREKAARRAEFLERKAARLPIASNAKRKALQQAAILRALAQAQ